MVALMWRKVTEKRNSWLKRGKGDSTGKGCVCGPWVPEKGGQGKNIYTFRRLAAQSMPESSESLLPAAVAAAGGDAADKVAAARARDRARGGAPAAALAAASAAGTGEAAARAPSAARAVARCSAEERNWSRPAAFRVFELFCGFRLHQRALGVRGSASLCWWDVCDVPRLFLGRERPCVFVRARRQRSTAATEQKKEGGGRARGRRMRAAGRLRFVLSPFSPSFPRL